MFILTRIQFPLIEIDAHLAGSAYLAGEECTVADILMTVIANWSGNFPQPIPLGANVQRVLKAVTARPSYQNALMAEGVEYKAAA